MSLLIFTWKFDVTSVAESQSSTIPFTERVHSINWFSDFSLYLTTSVPPIRNSPFLSGQPIVESTVIILSSVPSGSPSFVLYGTVKLPWIVSSERTNS